MKPANSRILTINGGSSSIKFAVFEAGASLQRILHGGIERIGLPGATFRVKDSSSRDSFSRPMTASGYPAAVTTLMEWISDRTKRGRLTAVGHRVVHGGPHYSQPTRITNAVIEELRVQDGRFHMEGGSWTSDMSWVRGYDQVLIPMEKASSLFHERALSQGVHTDEARYRNALFHLLTAETSCYRYWGQGIWTDYGSELSRRTSDILTHEF